MKVFLSWSGNESKQLAGIFKEWLPNVLQYVEPYMSAKDISLGERWNNNIIGSLEESVFGLIFVTPSNINAPWINYEAGALSKTFDSKVVPILYNADVMILNEGPLKQFQSAKNLERESILSLIKSINNSNKDGKLDELRLEKAFEMWWPTLNESIGEIVREDSAEGTAGENEPTEKELLSVIYSKITEQEKLLTRNQRINENRVHVPASLLKDLKNAYDTLKMCQRELDGGPFTDDFFGNIDDGIVGLERAINHFRNTRAHIKYFEKIDRASEI
ncbi:hypothetical protein [Peribacillus asahii]|uniref:hypothetical protein n=1 Tax=Peribacillus asahii TaxID=228899 RepID=UPI00382556EA